MSREYISNQAELAELYSSHKLATRLSAQANWVFNANEERYNEALTHQEQLEQLIQPPSNATSRFHLMKEDWKKFMVASSEPTNKTKQEVATYQLHILAKLLADSCNNAASVIWLRNQHPETSIRRQYIESLCLMYENVIQQSEKHSQEELERFTLMSSFIRNPIGETILGLHNMMVSNLDSILDNDMDALQSKAIDGVVASALILQYQGKVLEEAGLCSQMPSPSLMINDTQPWKICRLVPVLGGVFTRPVLLA